MRKPKVKEIIDYNKQDVTDFIDKDNPLKLSDLGIELPQDPPTKVVSIRLPTNLINKLKSYASQRDIPYSALIKLILDERMKESFKET
ncbi:MAG: BrnA antitoxin family protein [Melioribacteraceae bacterium]|nr:BrnA antitoxin family protein [Melioribacteraceae bacterium]MCF8412148.1 BrnA antitoxin family protein [Melioribacteraceae bacterium]MCF8432228.1 BrnA antitoxin family protein [Melioribacteraceae bacterium]